MSSVHCNVDQIPITVWLVLFVQAFLVIVLVAIRCRQIVAVVKAFVASEDFLSGVVALLSNVFRWNLFNKDISFIC